MRKLTAAQISAMAASMGFFTHAATRYGMPMLALAVGPAAVANDYDENEMEEVVVTGTRPNYSGPTWDVYIRPLPVTGGGVGVPSNPVASAPSNADTSLNRNALRCATRFSIEANVNPAGGGGQAPGFQTVFRTGWWWGSTNPDPNSNPRPIQTTTNQAPPGYQRIVGWTSRTDGTSYIYTTQVAYEAPARGISVQRNLVNTVGHEWSHQWYPWDETDQTATAAGDRTQQLFDAAGGMSGSCWTTPPHYGGTHK
ncbi:MAG TPA: hypothetical protein VM146_10285 [Steroidobacteraceae bacterium]|nr:hypothetical protein [Steroidobacteraceae bacterium]